VEVTSLGRAVFAQNIFALLVDGGVIWVMPRSRDFIGSLGKILVAST